MQPLIKRLKALFRQSPVKRIGQILYAACVDQSRQVPFYTEYGVADEIGARFELLTFHVGLVVTRLKSLPANDPRHEQALDTAQALFDAFLLALDSTLREQGTGDLTVPKKMKTLGIVIYTRMKHWDDLWRESASLAAQADYAARTIYAGSEYEAPESGDLAETVISHDIITKATAFAAYVESIRIALVTEDILAGKLNWPSPAPLATRASMADA
jgi:cytochrome b pre-mRNA-processing protein 3